MSIVAGGAEIEGPAPLGIRGSQQQFPGTNFLRRRTSPMGENAARSQVALDMGEKAVFSVEACCFFLQVAVPVPSLARGRECCFRKST